MAISEYKWKGKSITDESVTREELLEFINVLDEAQTSRFIEYKEKMEVYKKLLASPLPVHAMWRNFLGEFATTGLVVLIMCAVLKAMSN